MQRPIAAAVEALEPRRLLSAGQLDPTFGSGGVVVDNTHPGANAVVVQPDGKVVEAGLAHYGGQAVLSLTRFNTDGTPDKTFGYFGGLTQVLGTVGGVGKLALQSDGKILLSASANDQSFVHAVSILNRYLPNGQLDSSFGTGGEVTQPFNGTDSPIGIVVQSDGQIVVGDSQIGPTPFRGLPTPFLQLARYRANGSLDNAYGTAGIYSQAQAHANAIFSAMALEPDGRVVVVGNSADGAVLIDRVTTAGVLDGTVFATANLAGVNDVAAQLDGKVVISRDSLSAAITRFNLDGTLDSTFGTGGSALSGSYLTIIHFDHLLLQSDGKIVVSGRQAPEAGGSAYRLVRLNADGTPDALFGVDGQALVPAVPFNVGQPFSIALGNGIVVAGGGANELVLARVVGGNAQQGGSISGTVFNDDNNDGIQQPGEAPVYRRQVYLDLNGDDIQQPNEPVAGTDGLGHYTFSNLPAGNYVVRLVPLASSSITTSPVYGGKYYHQLAPGQNVTGDDFGTLGISGATAVQKDLKTLIARLGTYSGGISPLTLTRYGTDGAVDTTFGRIGVAAIGQIDSFGGYYKRVLVRPDGTIVVQWGKSNGVVGINLLTLISPTGQFYGTSSIGLFANGAGGFDMISQLVIAPDNKVVVAGVHFGGPAVKSQYVSRFNANFTPDMSFGNQGIVIVDANPETPATNLFVESDRSILVVYPGGKIAISESGAVSVG